MVAKANTESNTLSHIGCTKQEAPAVHSLLSTPEFFLCRSTHRKLAACIVLKICALESKLEDAAKHDSTSYVIRDPSST